MFYFSTNVVYMKFQPKKKRGITYKLEYPIYSHAVYLTDVFLLGEVSLNIMKISSKDFEC